MTARAFVLIETAVGSMTDVVCQMRDLPGIERVDAVTGPYDVIATVDVQDMSTIGDLITGSIHQIKGINRTVTCLAMAEK